MRALATALSDVRILEPTVHQDARGFFLESYRTDHLEAVGIFCTFVQDNYSRSVARTLRGLHWQWRRPQAKLIRVVAGAIFDVVVDIRKGSPTLGRWVGVNLSADDFRQLFVPVGFAHGFCVLSEIADIEYKCSDYYDPSGEAGLRWDDPVVGIEWPVSDPILSSRDAAHLPFSPNRSDLL
jgi:dTDP-4-dehydrorhamnose 3,5-epimerase